MKRRRGALVVGLALLAACGGTDNEYVEEQGSGMFLRLPSDWTVFQIEDGKPAADRGTDPDFGAWSVLIDGSAEPSRAHGEQALPASPVGTVRVVPLALFQSRPALVHSSLRSFFMPDRSDPLQAGLLDVEYDEIDLGHHWGNRLTATVEQSGGSVRVAQLAFVDDGGDLIHLVQILCSLECFEANAEEIDGILDSFTLEG